ncbi:MAG: putative metal-binding motif-containing protein [Myxococcota bacterium]
MLPFIASALAQVVPTGPFTGEITEGFETYPLTSAPLACLSNALGGAADVCATEASVGGMQVRDELFLGCLLSARTGTKMAGSNDGASEVVFDTPVDRFGAYMATHADDGDVTLEAYDVLGGLIGTVTEPLGGSCNWAWHGLQSTVPVASVRIRHSEHGGALVDLDDVQADTVCGVGASDGDGDGVPGCVDCNDADATVFPGAPDECNGIDEDCNGVLDDSPTGAGPSSLQAGVCAGSTLVCGPNSLVEPDYTLIPGYEADELTCDGIDNDCNGQIDDIDDIPPVSAVGICATIPQECAGELGWVSPLPEEVQGWESLETICDGIDNDCNGQVDDGLVPPPASFATGACSEMVKTCEGVDRWVEPEDFPPEFMAEVCNGIDDDCDGVVDDDCIEPSFFDKCGCHTSSEAGAWAWLGLAVLALRRR